jgi:uncharacterized protein (DUF362 family)
VYAFRCPPTSVYDGEFPFLHDLGFPELASMRIDRSKQPTEDAPLALVRSLLRLADLDTERFGTPQWNPMGEWIRPGMSVLIKPNLVYHQNLSGQDLYASIVHPSIVAAIMAYVAIALKGRGRVMIGDAPQWNCDMVELLKAAPIDKMCCELEARLGVPCVFLDLRRNYAEYDSPSGGLIKQIVELDGDPRGYVDVEMNGLSAFHEEKGLDSLYGSDFDREGIISCHHKQRHAYNISRSVLEADVIINVPKIKTHKKAGMTCALKNIIGVIGNKNCLPHFRVGFDSNLGQDEMPRPSGNALGMAAKRMKHFLLWQINDNLLSRRGVTSYWAAKILLSSDRAIDIVTGNKINVREGASWGNWYGNNTIGCTTRDLNLILNFADKDGVISPGKKRKIVNIVDGIVGGEGEGPLSPMPKKLDLLVLTTNSFANDWIIARMMGFDPQKIPTLRKIEQMDKSSLVIGVDPREIVVCSNDERYRGAMDEANKDPLLQMVPCASWAGHIEID